jgi:hypothetical protein
MAYPGLIRSTSRRVTARGARRMAARLLVVALIAAFLAPAQGNSPERVKVLVEDLTETAGAVDGRKEPCG